jgi:ribulose-phosphate 3-epimerase
MTELAPAILTNDLSDFRKQYAELFSLSQYFKRLHIDFIDGEYLPNKTLEIKSLDFLQSRFILAAHFMTFDPKQYFEEAKKLGFFWVLFHFDAFQTIDEIIETINEARKLNLKTGLALNPDIPLYKAAEILDEVDLVQIMGIHPGAQGRPFEAGTYEKVKELKRLKKNAIISVDGGVKISHARALKEAGVDIMVVGSAIAKSSNKKETVEQFLKEIR